ncbi:MAG TPA: sugar ABC transporter substrate-binding protein [Virgibacillus sp.]|nr:sugar ABC transporter substrate-binding protein [Virgibacillus sp.]
MMKRYLSLIMFLLVIGLVVGCGSDNNGNNEGENTDAINNSSENNKNSDGKVQISFWDENAGPQRTPIWEELISQFEDENPDIEVEYLGLPSDSSKSKYDAAIAGNDMPDVASVQTSWLPEFSIREALLPLDDYLAESELNGLINEGAIEFNQKIVQDDQLYGIPYTQNLDVIWIRSDRFEEEGVKVPETWDDFFTAVEEMTDDEHYGYTIRGGAGGSFQLQRLMFAYSGHEEYIDDDGNAVINDPKHVEFLEKYFDLYDTYTPKSDITNDYKEMIAGFDTGVVSMVHHNIGSFGEHNKSFDEDQFEAIPLPTTEDGKYVAEGGNTINMSIFNTTEHPDEAWKFVEFINSADSQSYWNEEVGQIPTNSDVLEKDWIEDAPHIHTAFEVYDDPDTILYEAPFYLPDYRQILDNTVDSGIQAVLSGDETVEEFLDTWAKEIEESEEKYRDAFD